MWVKVPEWSDKFSKWLELKKLVLFSSMKSTQLEELDLMVDQGEITRFKGLCYK